MATTESVALSHANADKSGRRHPFTSWMKKLTHFKTASNENGQASGSKRNAQSTKSQLKKIGNKNNNPYMTGAPGSAHATVPVNRHLSFSTGPTGRTVSTSSLERSRRSFQSSLGDAPPPTVGGRSIAHTASTEHDTGHLDLAQSHGTSSGAGTAATTAGGLSSGRGADSTFSSPAPSLQSLATTLTTIQSTTAGTGANSHPATTDGDNGNHAVHSGNTPSIQFTHQFPTSNPPTALPAHLAPQGSGGHPSTYITATANNLLTDNASIMTLASSSRRRRRHSMDTDASVRALAPSSLFGGSRESLPLSVLSANIDPHNTSTGSGMHQPRPSMGGPAAERASLYSTGVAPALPSDRNSYYASKQSTLGDGGSVKSGLLGHGRTESINGSIGGIAAANSPLASPRETLQADGLSA